jgi:hypothetical protein
MRWFAFPLYRAGRVALLLAAPLLFSPLQGEAQTTRADSAAILLRVAEDFQEEGRTAVAEALFHYISERFGDTWAGSQAMAALRTLPEEGRARSSQVELMVWATTYGAWLGIAIPGAFAADGPEAYGAGLLLGAPLGFLGGRALARSRSLSEGQVRAITFGSLWGTWMGFGIMEVLDWGERDEICYDWGCEGGGDRDGSDVFKSFVVGGLAGTLTGSMLARKPISRGVATTANFGALWGSWFGVAGGILADLEGDPLLTSTLIGGNAGLLGAALAAPGWNMSRNRARLISIAGVIGGLAGAGLDLMIQPDGEKVAVGIPLAASIVGLAVGAGLTSQMDQRGAESLSGGDDDGESPGSSNSLLRLHGGRFSLGVPSPFPTLVPVEGARGFSYRPALGVTLLQGRF